LENVKKLQNGIIEEVKKGNKEEKKVHFKEESNGNETIEQNSNNEDNKKDNGDIDRKDKKHKRKEAIINSPIPVATPTIKATPITSIKKSYKFIKRTWTWRN